MAWRSILIANKAHASVKRGQLHLQREEGAVTVPLEDIAVVVFENRHITLTTALLSQLCAAGATILVCDGTHHPNGAMMPFLTHSRVSQIAAEQIQWSAPFKKRIWQKIVQQKIKNQAHLLDRVDPLTAKALQAMRGQVDSGDRKNREAQAARAYWPALMGKDFLRSGNDLTNAALNYGYAVVRACVARALVGAGLLPCFGLHHDNDLNNFNLADDLIEPFRPMVDAKVLSLRKDRDPDDPLTQADRLALVGMGAEQVLMDGEVMTLLNAAQITAESLVRALKAKDPTPLKMPEFVL